MQEKQIHKGKPPRLLAVKEVAAVLRIDQSTVHGWIRGGMLSAIQFGGRGHTVRILSTELVRLANSPPIGPATEAAPHGVEASPPGDRSADLLGNFAMKREEEG
jgi:excisionase family DNA binding protein